MQNFPVGLRRLAPKSLVIYSMKRIALASSQGLALLGFFLYVLSFSQSLVNADDFYLYDKALIFKHSLILSNTNTKI